MTPQQITAITPQLRQVAASVEVAGTDPGTAARQLEAIVRRHGLKPGDVMLHLLRQAMRAKALPKE